MTDLRYFAQMASPTVVADGGTGTVARGTRTGELYTVTWKQALLFEGRCFQMTVGSLTGGADIAMITGGGAGTTIDQDQPEFGVSVPAGTTLIPLEIHISCQVDMDADGEEGNIVVAYDTAAAVVGGTSTPETPVNLLTGTGQASVATAFSATTADITDPTVSGILAFKTIQGSDNGVAANAVMTALTLDYEPETPIFLTGPAAFYGYWGGTAAVPGMASVIWAEVPSARFANF